MSHVPPDDAEQALRLKRMASVYGRMVQPTGAEIAAKWQAQQLPAPPKQPWAAPGPVASVAAGLIICGILAAGAAQLQSDAPETEPAPAVSSSLPPESRAPRVSPATAPTPSSEPSVRVELPVADHPRPDEASDSRPAPVSQRTAAEPAVQASEDTTQRWRTVAAALRENDTPRARAVLTKLSKSSDPSTRDAAALARAQLDAADGKVSSARAVFERVAREGTTSQLRAQAQRSLRQLETKGE